MARKPKAFGVKRKATGPKVNPFDLKFQRKRHNVLGSNKNGANSTPLGTRKVAHELRKRTIGNELRLLNKQNKVRDQRLGQQNPNLTAAQKAEMRLIAQRKHSAKKSKFLLNDDDGENLEHLASGLTQAEKFQRGKGNEANEEDELDPELMAQASFGGGTLEENGSKKRLSRQELIKQAIERSVQAKAIKRRDRAVQFDQWEKLDEQFTELKEAGELKFGRSEIPKEDGDDEYMELFQQLEQDHRVPAKREWATELTKRDAEAQETKELERIESQKQTLFKSKEKLTFPMAVDQISATKVRHSLDLAQLLLVCHDVAVFLEDNRRYCPEVIGFLLNTLMIANEVDKHENLLSNFPAKQHFLHFEEKSTVEKITPLSIALLKEAKTVDDMNENRLLDLQVLQVAVRLVRFFAQLYDNIFEAYPLIFGQFQSQLERLPIDNYPDTLRNEVTDTLKIVQELVNSRSKLTHLHKSAAQKIKMIDMLEPRVEQHFNARHPTHKRDDPQANVKRLQKRVKKEIRGTVKELRQDARFIAGEQARVRRQVDDERQKKTNQIMASLQTQESEYKKRKSKKF